MRETKQHARQSWEGLSFSWQTLYYDLVTSPKRGCIMNLFMCRK